VLKLLAARRSYASSQCFSTLREGRAKHKIAVAQRRAFLNWRRSHLHPDASFLFGVAAPPVGPNCRRPFVPSRRPSRNPRLRRPRDGVGYSCPPPPPPYRRQTYAPRFRCLVHPPARQPLARADLSARGALPACPARRAAAHLGRERPAGAQVSRSAR